MADTNIGTLFINHVNNSQIFSAQSVLSHLYLNSIIKNNPTQGPNNDANISSIAENDVTKNGAPTGPKNDAKIRSIAGNY